MAKLTGTQKQALENAVKFGFTFMGDSIATTYLSAKRALSSLVRDGLLISEMDDEGRTAYLITERGRDVLKYGF